MKLVILFRGKHFPHKRSSLLLIPVIMAVCGQGIISGLSVSHFMTPERIDFVIIDWVSEQLFTNMIVTMILFGCMTNGWGIRRYRINTRLASLLIILFIIQYAIIFSSNWLTITSVVAIPSIFAILYLGFSWAIFITGCFATLSIIGQMYYYFNLDQLQHNDSAYLSIFAHRFNSSLVIILIVTMAGLISKKNCLLYTSPSPRD